MADSFLCEFVISSPKTKLHTALTLIETLPKALKMADEA